VSESGVDSANLLPYIDNDFWCLLASDEVLKVGPRRMVQALRKEIDEEKNL